MKKLLIKGALTLSTLFLFAVPALPDTLSFGLSGITATFNGTSNGSALTNFTATVGSVTTTNGTANGAYFADTTATLTFLQILNGLDEFSLSGTLALNGSTNPVNGVLDFTINPVKLGVNTAGGCASTGYCISLLGGTTTLVSNTFTNLGIPGGTDSVSIASGFSNVASTINGSDQISPTSLAFVTTILATPEPASFILFGTGLMCAGLIGRRRLAQRVS